MWGHNVQLKQGRVATEILLMLVTVVITSAIVFTLVQTGIISVKDSGESLLNTEFLPYERAGSFVVKEFQFCSFVDYQYNCIEEKDVFSLGEQVHFKFIVESSTSDGEIVVVENYRLRDPSGRVVLEAETKDNLYFEISSRERLEDVYFKDFIITEANDMLGTHTLELLIANPLLNKQVTLAEEFELQ